MASASSNINGVRNDIGQLYPGMLENVNHRLDFIAKVYELRSLQLLMTCGVACVLPFLFPVKDFMQTLPGGFITFFSVCMVSLALCGPMLYYRHRFPWNSAFMALFALTNGCMICLACALEKGVTLLEAAASTAYVNIVISFYTFWAARRGLDFSFLGPFLFSSLSGLIYVEVFRITFPMGRKDEWTVAAIEAIVLSLFLVYANFKLIKLYRYDDYVEAAFTLYLVILNIFLALVQVIGDEHPSFS